MINVLFVCLGNICRSPTAEAVFRRLVQQHHLDGKIGVDSAATHPYQTGRPPDPRSCSVARRHGIEMADLRARTCGPDDFRRFDYVLAMDRGNLADLAPMQPADSRARLALFLAFAPAAGRDEVPDPYNADAAAFDAVFALIDVGARGLLDHLRRDLG